MELPCCLFKIPPNDSTQSVWREQKTQLRFQSQSGSSRDIGRTLNGRICESPCNCTHVTFSNDFEKCLLPCTLSKDGFHSMCVFGCFHFLSRSFQRDFSFCSVSIRWTLSRGEHSNSCPKIKRSVRGCLLLFSSFLYLFCYNI